VIVSTLPALLAAALKRPEGLGGLGAVFDAPVRADCVLRACHNLCDHAGDGRLERVDGFGVLDFHQRLALLDPVAYRFGPLNNSALAHAHALQRLSAILNLRWDDVDFAKGMIRWCAEHDKVRRTWIVPMQEAGPAKASGGT
jgi:hypothetical protein